MSKIKMDIDTTKSIQTNLLEDLSDISSEASRYYDAISTLLHNQYTKAEFLNAAAKSVNEVKETEKRLITCMNDLLLVINDAIKRTENTEDKFKLSFKELVDDKFTETSLNDLK